MTKHANDSEKHKRLRRKLALEIAETIVGYEAPEKFRDDKQFQKFVSDLVKKGVNQDPVTGIPNRRAYDVRILRAISRAQREHEITVGWIDIDNFKNYNKKHTHAGGDAVLKHVASIIMDSVRDTDFVARVGGDEFAVIFWDTDENEAKELLKRIRENIQGKSCRYDKKNLPVDVSFGYHTIQGSDTPETIQKISSDTLLTQQIIRKEVEGPWTARETGRNPGKSLG